MNKFIGTLFYATIFLVGCSRKDDKPTEFIQVNVIEAENTAYHFKYNEQEQLNRFEVWRKPDGSNTKTLYSYVAINFTNSRPESADFYIPAVGGALYRQTEATYHYNLLNRLAYTVFQFFDENGNPLTVKNDTLDLKFDADNRIISIGYRDPYFTPSEYSYDAQGNLIQLEQNITTQAGHFNYTYQHSYDNKINPFATNGTGTTLCILYFNSYFYPYELLSAKVPVSYKMFTTINNGSSISKYEESTQHKNRYDGNGILIGQTLIMADDYNGTPSSEEINYQFTCSKK